MISPRQLIRRAIVDGLKREHTSAGTRVFANRTRPVWKDDPPVLLVYTLREPPPTLFQVTPRVYERVLSVVVEAVDVASSDPDDAVDERLDELGRAVELFFFRDRFIGLGEATLEGFEIKDTMLGGFELVLYQVDGRSGDQPLAGLAMTFLVTYLDESIESGPGVLQPFQGADIAWVLKPGDELEDARDKVDLAGS